MHVSEGIKKETVELFLSIIEEAICDKSTNKLLSFVVDLSNLKGCNFDFLKIIRYLNNKFSVKLNFKDMKFIFSKKHSPFNSEQCQNIPYIAIYKELIDKGGKEWRGCHRLTYQEERDLEIYVSKSNDPELANRYYKAIDKSHTNKKAFGPLGTPQDPQYNRYKIKTKHK